MKFNWGTGIAGGIVCFMTFILQYVIRVQFDDRYNNELVTENYYQKETEVNSNRLKSENAHALGGSLRIEATTKGIELVFPEDIRAAEVKGSLSLYRPSNEKLDQVIPLKLTSARLLIPHKQLASGRWDVTLEYRYEGRDYLKRETLMLP